MFAYLVFENSVELRLPLSYSLSEITILIDSFSTLAWPTPLGTYSLLKVEGLGRFDQLINSSIPLESRKIVSIEDALSVALAAESFASLVGSASLELLYLLVTDYDSSVSDLSSIISTNYKGLWPTQEEYVSTSFSTSNPSCVSFMDYLDVAKYTLHLKSTKALYTVKASNASGYYLFDFT